MRARRNRSAKLVEEAPVSGIGAAVTGTAGVVGAVEGVEVGAGMVTLVGEGVSSFSLELVVGAVIVGRGVAKFVPDEEGGGIVGDWVPCTTEEVGGNEGIEGEFSVPIEYTGVCVTVGFAAIAGVWVGSGETPTNVFESGANGKTVIAAANSRANVEARIIDEISLPLDRLKPVPCQLFSKDRAQSII
jgi:hypothetical protein